MIVDFRRRIIKRHEGEPSPGSEQEATVSSQSAATETKPAEDGHTCPNCKAPMDAEQDWCTQCGERSSGKMRARAGWYSAGVITVASAILASGAAAAGIAALNQGGTKEPSHESLAQVPVTTTSATPSAPVTPTSPGPPETLKAHPHPPRTLARTLTTTQSRTTSASEGSGGSSASGTGAGTGSSTHSSETTTTSQSATPENELQGLTASAYTLNQLYPKASLEGPENDPSRALEGRESGTAWSVSVKPGTNENLNVGLLIALGGPTRVGTIELHTSTPGFLLEVYGSTESKPPTELSAWKRLGLTPSLKASAVLKLAETNKHMRFVLLWIPKVPSKLSRVAIGEVELFPPA